MGGLSVPSFSHVFSLQKDVYRCAKNLENDQHSIATWHGKHRAGPDINILATSLMGCRRSMKMVQAANHIDPSCYALIHEMLRLVVATKIRNNTRRLGQTHSEFQSLSPCILFVKQANMQCAVEGCYGYFRETQ